MVLEISEIIVEASAQYVLVRSLCTLYIVSLLPSIRLFSDVGIISLEERKVL